MAGTGVSVGLITLQAIKAVVVGVDLPPGWMQAFSMHQSGLEVQRVQHQMQKPQL